MSAMNRSTDEREALPWLAIYLPKREGSSGLHVWIGCRAIHVFWPPWRRKPGPHLQFTRSERSQLD